MTQPVLLTSLSPSADTRDQLDAIESWKSAGFQVFSVNTAAEEAALKVKGHTLDFLTPAKTAEAVAGKPVPFIHEMLELGRKTVPDADVVGIINDDIFIRCSEHQAHQIVTLASQSVVLGPRIDIPAGQAFKSFTAEAEPVFSIGYDAVFLPRAFAEHLPAAPFSMGMPFWDYWIPIQAIAAGWDIQALADPVLLHKQHDTKWDATVYVYFHALAQSLLMALETGRPSNEDPGLSKRYGLMIDMLTHVYQDIFDRGTSAPAPEGGAESLAAFYDRLQEVLVHHIKLSAAPFKLA